jgi:hypothetical protein
VSGHILFTGVNLDAWNDACIGYDFNKGSAIFPGLTDRLVIKDGATDKLTQPGSGQNHFPIRATRFLGLRNPHFFKSPVAGGVTLIHGEKTFALSDYRLGSGYKHLCTHL